MAKTISITVLDDGLLFGWLDTGELGDSEKYVLQRQSIRRSNHCRNGKPQLDWSAKQNPVAGVGSARDIHGLWCLGGALRHDRSVLVGLVRDMGDFGLANASENTIVSIVAHIFSGVGNGSDGTDQAAVTGSRTRPIVAALAGSLRQLKTTAGSDSAIREAGIGGATCRRRRSRVEQPNHSHVGVFRLAVEYRIE